MRELGWYMISVQGCFEFLSGVGQTFARSILSCTKQKPVRARSPVPKRTRKGKKEIDSNCTCALLSKGALRMYAFVSRLSDGGIIAVGTARHQDHPCLEG